MFEVEKVNLRAADRSDVPLIKEWWSDRKYMGEHQDPLTISEEKLEEIMLQGTMFFIIEKKDRTRIGYINSWTRGKTREIGYALVPSERGKGYGTEAIQIMLDYLFLNTDVIRIQVSTVIGNLPSQRVLEKVGFTREGPMRKASYVGGEYRDMYLYSILREEWEDKKASKSRGDLFLTGRSQPIPCKPQKSSLVPLSAQCESQP